jgi:hypothetical protein
MMDTQSGVNQKPTQDQNPAQSPKKKEPRPRKIGILKTPSRAQRTGSESIDMGRLTKEAEVVRGHQRQAKGSS